MEVKPNNLSRTKMRTYVNDRKIALMPKKRNAFGMIALMFPLEKIVYAKYINEYPRKTRAAVLMS